MLFGKLDAQISETVTKDAQSTAVSGGQQIYLAPDGSLRYIQAHSMNMRSGSLQCPLSFTQVRDDSDASQIMISGFGSRGFMACPMLSSQSGQQQWQVYANIPNATVPLLRSNASSCLEFEAIGVEKELGHSPAAWQYI